MNTRLASASETHDRNAHFPVQYPTSLDFSTREDHLQMMAAFLREEFEFDPGMTYMNWGTHSIAPSRVLEAVQAYQREYETNPTQGVLQSYGRMWKIQTELGRWLRADPKDLFLRMNVSEVMNAFILGVPLEPGSEILSSSTEYPAIGFQCRYRAERDGLTHRTFELPFEPEATIDSVVSSIVDALTPQTKLVVLCHIFSGSGLVLPLQDVARETRKRGVLLAVDGAHAPGTFPLDFSQYDDLDFYGGNLHKWFMGPKGTSFGWVNKRHHERLKPLAAGWLTYDPKPPASDFGEGSVFTRRMAMIGCRDYAPFYALHDTLGFWKEHGEAKLREETFKVQESLRDRIEKQFGLRPLSPPAGLMRGPLMSFEIPASNDPGTLMNRLYERHRVQIMATNYRGRPMIRLSPHFSTSETELETTTDALRAELLP